MKVSKTDRRGKKGQEEMVGFALIIVIVAIVLLFFLVFAFRGDGKEAAESFELDSFLQSGLQETTDCEISGKRQDLRAMTFSCIEGRKCDDNLDSCTILETEWRGVLEASWPNGPERPVKGYEFLIVSGETEVLRITAGNATNNYKGALQDLAKGGETSKITLRVYN